MKRLLLLSSIAAIILISATGWMTPSANSFNFDSKKSIFSSGVIDSSSLDVTEDARKMNGPDAPKPSSKFRTGHVTPGTVQTSVKQTDWGFEINVGSASQVPTPSVHQGKLYVGGGFGSRVFHCFDAKTGKMIWSKNLDDDGPSSAVADQNIVVFNTESCTIFACDINTGEHIWSWWLGDPLMSMPTIANGKVYSTYPASGGYINENNSPNLEGEDLDIQSPAVNHVTPPSTSRLRATHVLACFDLKTGKVLWQKWVDGDAISAPVANGNEILLATFPGTLYKFNSENGDIIEAMASRATSAPVVYDGKLFYSKRNEVHGEAAKEAIVMGEVNKSMKTIDVIEEKEAPYLDKNVQSGSKLKETSTHLDAGNGFSGGAPASAGADYAMENVGQSNVASLQSFQGSRVLNYKNWTYSMMGDELICTDNRTGVSEWGTKLDGDLQSDGGFLGTPPLMAGGKIIMGTLKGDIIIIEKETGKEIKRISTGNPIRQQPVVQDGWIYVSSTGGKVMAINSGDASLTGWPVWGGDVGHSGAPVN